MGPQLDIDAIEATVAALTEEAGEGGTLIERDVPALCAEVRQLRQALAAVEKLCSDPAYVFDVGVACIRVSGIRAALGAAVTPTPQEPKCICDGGAYIDKMKPDWRPFVVNPQCVLHGIGPSTPEAATERPGQPGKTGGEGAGLLDANAYDSPPSPLSGLQRATEQQ